MQEENWDRMLERHRPTLLLLARQNVHPRLWKDVDPSGVVQKTMMDADKGREQCEASGSGGVLGWLRRILLNNLYDEIRRVHRQMRDVGREVALAGAFDESTRRLEPQLSGKVPTPSEELMRSEKLLALASAVERLDEGQRAVVELHHLQGRSLEETAAILGRTKSSVAALLHRGLKKLKEFLKEGETT